MPLITPSKSCTDPSKSPSAVLPTSNGGSGTIREIAIVFAAAAKELSAAPLPSDSVDSADAGEDLIGALVDEVLSIVDVSNAAWSRPPFSPS